MSGYHDNLLSYCADGIGAVFVYCTALVFSLLLGAFLGMLITQGGFIVDVSGTNVLLWFGGMVTGLIQFWGLLSYFIIALEVIALFRADSHRWLILLTILMVQTCETARMLLDIDDRSAWLQAVAIAGIVALPIGHALLHYRMERVPEDEEAIWNHCRSCGYNLTGTLMARGTSCPECGERVSQYQHIRSVAEQRKAKQHPAASKD